MHRLMSVRRRPVRRITLLAIVVLASIAVPAHAALTAFGPVAAATKFPAWYQDASGLKLAPCPASTANCPVAPAAGAVPSTYANAIGRFLSAGPAHTGRVDLQEFIAGVVAVPGGAIGGVAQPVTEAKLVITADGLDPNSTYQVTYPYGTTTIFTDATGARIAGAAAGAAGAATAGAVMPVPDRATVTGPEAALSATVSVAERGPEALGVKATSTVQRPGAAGAGATLPPVAGQVPVGAMAKSAALAPPIVIALMASGTVASLEIVIVLVVVVAVSVEPRSVPSGPLASGVMTAPGASLPVTKNLSVRIVLMPRPPASGPSSWT